MKINSIRYLLFQIFIWGVGWLFLLLILSNGAELNARFWHRTALMVIGASIVVLINVKYLLPQLYFPGKSVQYYVFSTVLLLIVVWGMHSDLLPWNQREDRRVDRIEDRSPSRTGDESKTFEVNNNLRWLMRNLPPLFISLLGSSLVSISRFAAEKEKTVIQLEKAKLETEIKFLKSQINPHFLFNTLHNIYALTIIQSDRASEQLLKLSDILRYMLYDSNQEKVLLKRELEYLKNYLELAKLKDSRDMDVRFDLGEIDGQLLVAPLLFIPFVENAFKHSQFEDLKNGFINISLNTKGNSLTFKVKNSKPQQSFSKDKLGGIGLTNIQQRLRLLYPEKHHLLIEERDTTFEIFLELNCS